MENKKATFITIVVLLCIFAPLTIISLIIKGDHNLLEENPNHDTFYKGHIWFYDNNDNFLSKYECQTEICEFTTPTIDDAAYQMNYYKEGTITKIPVINNKYAFITDGAVIDLYSVTTGTILQTYKAVKNYNTNISGGIYILQNSNGLWGAITINESLSPVLPFEYDFIGLTNEKNDYGTLNASEFIVSKDSKWYLVNNENSALTGYIDNPIIEYNDKYIFSKNSDKVRIYSYENYEYLTNYSINKYILVDDYIGIITDNFLLIYDDLGKQYLKSVTLTNITGEITLEKKDNKLDVKINDEVIESVELS